MSKSLILKELMEYQGKDFVVTPNLLGFIQNIKTISKEVLECLLVTSFEGGSMWFICKEIPNRDWMEKKENFTDFLTRMFMEVDGYELPIYSNDDEEELLGTLTYQGIEEAFENSPLHYGNFSDESYDADDADYIMQFAVLGELVYG